MKTVLTSLFCIASVFLVGCQFQKPCKCNLGYQAVDTHALSSALKKFDSIAIFRDERAGVSEAKLGNLNQEQARHIADCFAENAEDIITPVIIPGIGEFLYYEFYSNKGLEYAVTLMMDGISFVVVDFRKERRVEYSAASVIVFDRFHNLARKACKEKLDAYAKEKLSMYPTDEQKWFSWLLKEDVKSGKNENGKNERTESRGLRAKQSTVRGETMSE